MPVAVRERRGFGGYWSDLFGPDTPAMPVEVAVRADMAGIVSDGVGVYCGYHYPANDKSQVELHFLLGIDVMADGEKRVIRHGIMLEWPMDEGRLHDTLLLSSPVTTTNLVAGEMKSLEQLNVSFDPESVRAQGIAGKIIEAVNSSRPLSVDQAAPSYSCLVNACARIERGDGANHHQASKLQL